MFKVGDKIRLVSIPVEGKRRIGEIMTVCERLPGSEKSVLEVVCFENANGEQTWCPAENFELVKSDPFIENSTSTKLGSTPKT